MGKVLRPEDIYKPAKKRIPAYIEEGLKDLNPKMREKVEEIITSDIERFRNLKMKEILKILKEEYNIKV